MFTRKPYLTKSRYVQGIACEKLLWLGWHEKLPYEEPEPGSPAAVGIEVGRHAHKLFPGGVVVTEEPWQHDQAVRRTKALMADPAVPAIFEAAFDYKNIRIRADAIERRGGGWALCEVKSSTKVKPEHLDDAAIQYHVMTKVGVNVTAVELVHVNTEYVRGTGEIDWSGYFTRTDLMRDVKAVMAEVAEEVRAQHAILASKREPEISASPHCVTDCKYWDRCTKDKPDDWIMQLPRLSQRKFDELEAMGIERIKDIPDDFELTAAQDRVWEVIVSGEDYVSPTLGAALKRLAAGALYLDFEAMNPAIPIYPGTRPYQRIAFQWSLHKRIGGGRLAHEAYLAQGSSDPRREFAMRLIEAVSGSDLPIIVYSSYERQVLSELARDFPDLALGLEPVLDRLFDLLEVVRRDVYLRRFHGSYSVKAVGPALAPDFSYKDLETVKDGQAASIAFQKIAAGLGTAEDAQLRKALLDYCARDTLAMVAVHDGLLGLANGMRAAAE